MADPNLYIMHCCLTVSLATLNIFLLQFSKMYIMLFSQMFIVSVTTLNIFHLQFSKQVCCPNYKSISCIVLPQKLIFQRNASHMEFDFDSFSYVRCGLTLNVANAIVSVLYASVICNCSRVTYRFSVLQV